MQALILDRNHSSAAWMLLKNGETVLGRQLRLLHDCGIDQFIIQLCDQKEAIKEICSKFKGCTFTFVESGIAEHEAFCPAWMENYIDGDTVVLPNTWVFSKKFLQDFLQKEHSFMTAVGNMLREADETCDALKVKVDMNKAQYLSKDIVGYGAFEMIPIYKISADALQNCLHAQKQADTLEAAYQAAAKAMPLQTFYCEDYWIKDASQAEDPAALVERIQTLYRKELASFIGNDSLFTLKNVLTEKNLRKLFVITDCEYDALAIKHVLTDGFEIKLYPVEEDPMQSRQAAALVESESYDAIVSVGGTKAVEYAKLVKLWLCWDGESEISELQCSNIPHIAVVTRIEKLSVYSPFVLLDGQKLEHDMFFPNMLVCDPRMYTEEEREQRLYNALELFCYNLDILLGYRADDHIMDIATENLSTLSKAILPYVKDPMSKGAAGTMLKCSLQAAKLLACQEEEILPVIAKPLIDAYGLPVAQASLYCTPGILCALEQNISAKKVKLILNALSVKTVKQGDALLTNLCCKLCCIPGITSVDEARELAQQVVLSDIRGIGIIMLPSDITKAYAIIWNRFCAKLQKQLAVASEEQEDTALDTQEEVPSGEQTDDEQEDAEVKDQEAAASEEQETDVDQAEGESVPADPMADVNSWASLLSYAGVTKPKNKKKKKATGLKGKIKHILYKKFSNQSIVRKVFNRLVFIRRRLKYLNLRRKYPVNKKMIVFDSFNGKKYNCNPKGIYEALLRDPAYCDFTFVWAFLEPQKYEFLTENPNTRVVKIDSLKYRQFCARAGYWIANAGMPAYLLPKKDQQYIHTWHGKPFKAIGCDVGFKTAGGRGAKENRKVYTALSRKLTCLFSPSRIFTDKMTSAFNLKYLGKEDIVYESGYPRNDYLFNYDPQDVIKVKMSLGIPLDKKVILYAPTWRPTVYQPGVGYIYHNPMDFNLLHEALGDDYIVIFRAHINEAKSVDFTRYGDFLIDATQVEDVNDLYIISDLMISDYSGTIFDYANLKRPMVLYMYDKESYMNDWTGTYFQPEDLPGEIVTTQEEMHASIIRQLENFEYDEKYRNFNATFNALDGPDCAKRVIEHLIDPAPQPTKAEERRENFKAFVQRTKVKIKGAMRVLGLTSDRNAKLLKSYKNKHAGERCFLVGNGPSLTMKDLEKIQNDVTFSCNLVYKIFDKTSWRPTYHCITDNIFTKTISKELLSKIQVPLFMNSTAYQAMKLNGKAKKSQKIISVQSIAKDPYYVKGNMLNYYVSSKATVMSFMIELAIYMGFKEIYLIGVDCSNGFVGQNSHFIEDYENEDMMRIEHKRAKNLMRGKHMTLEELGKYRTDRAMFAYSVLRKFADAKGVKVYNATRGGYLEEFERVNLDDLEFTVE